MITKTLKEEVRLEAKQLRVLATKDERKKVNFLKVIKKQGNQSIYEQMTGDLFSFRAEHLIKFCAKGISYVSLDSKNETKKGRGGYTPIERYIFQKFARKNELLKYIKGRKEILDI